MYIACDEAGHTGPNLLADDQKIFSFASVNINDDEAWEIIADARKAFPVQMPELKASRLLSSDNGRRLISFIIDALDQHFAINAHDKLLALCGWIFEYVFEPVYKENPRIFYEKDFHRFIAMFCYLWIRDNRADAAKVLAQFQSYMRSKDIDQAPILFNFVEKQNEEQPHPFQLVQRFATGHRDAIAKDNENIRRNTRDAGTWTLDLSASALWSHLNHWGRTKQPLTVICDESKPLRSIAPDLAGPTYEGVMEYANAIYGHSDIGWELAAPIEFVDSRAHPSVQLADVLAGTTAFGFANGLPEGMEKIGEMMHQHMLRDSIFPDFERVDLKKDPVKVHYAILYELAVTAEGFGTGAPIEAYIEIAEKGVASGELNFH